mgnify:CR=1 FL=1
MPQDAPLIIAGDFNDWRRKGDRTLTDELGVYEVFEEVKGRPARTFPSVLPVFRLDRIYAREASTSSTPTSITRFPQRPHCPTMRRWPRRSRYRAGAAERRTDVERFATGNRIELLRNGGEFFPALIAAIRRAEREIWLETYIFADDASGGRSPPRWCARRNAASRCVCWSTAGARSHYLTPSLARLLARRRRATAEIPAGSRAAGSSARTGCGGCTASSATSTGASPSSAAST